MNLLSPEVLHLLFAVGGAVLGWVARHHSLGVSPDVLAAVEQLLARQRQQQAHGLLQDLLDKARPAPPHA